MDVFQYLQKITVPVDGLAFIPALKQIPASVIFIIEPMRIAEGNLFNNKRQTASRRIYEQMYVIIHKAISVQLKPALIFITLQSG
jgi:hypothetical protein